MSILGADFEEHVDKQVKNMFAHCDLVVMATYCNPNELTLIDVGKIIGPLEYTDNSKLRFVKEYSDIMTELNGDSILKGLGLKQILSARCRLVTGQLIQLILGVRLISGGVMDVGVVYQHLKNLER